MKIYGWPKYIRIKDTRDYVVANVNEATMRSHYRSLRNKGLLDYQARQMLVNILRRISSPTL